MDTTSLTYPHHNQVNPAHVSFQSPRAFFNNKQFANIFKIEELEELEADFPFPFKNKKVNTSKHKHYTEYFNDELIWVVEKIYKDDIELLGYQYGE